MIDPRFPGMDQGDPFESEDDDALDHGSDDADADTSGSAPGSLASLRIRKRAPTPRQSAGAPRRAEARPPAAPAVRAPAIDRRRPDLPDPGLHGQEPARQDPPLRRPVMSFTAAPGAINEPVRRDPPPPHSATVPSRPALETDLSATQGNRVPPANLVAYWTQLKGNRRYPKVTDLEYGRITSTWPNSILMRCRPGSKALQPDRVFSNVDSATGGLSSLRTSGRINLSPMMLQWLLGLATEVVRAGRAMQDEEEFPSSSRSTRYRAVALPFSNDDRSVDHVLCHVAPAK